MGYQSITAVGSSIDGRLWFYDNIAFKLKKIDESGTVFRESQALNVLLGQTPNPNFILERDNQVYVNDSALGILVFDQFGSYNKTIPLKGLTRFQILQNQIVYQQGNDLISYHMQTLQQEAITLPDSEGVIQAAIEKDVLGILKKDHADFYKY
jgi:hypothetical protein